MCAEKSQDHYRFVTFTARLMAAMRARESARKDALFNDPFAQYLAGDEAFQHVDQNLSKQDQAYVAVRTHFFDNFLLSSKTDQVVILASGLDTRSYRLPWAKGVKVYEIDHPEVLDLKTSILENKKPSCEKISIDADLTKTWENKLVLKGFSKVRPSTWLLEGLLMYLSEDEVHSLLSSISYLAAAGSSLGLDLINSRSLRYKSYKGYFRSGWDNPEDLLSAYGWEAEVLQPGEEDANFNRYPWLLPPREVEGIERVFFLRAIRNGNRRY